MKDRRTRDAGRSGLVRDRSGRAVPAPAMVSVVPRGEGPAGSGAEDMLREPGQGPGSARTAPTLLGVVRAVASAVVRHPEASLVIVIIIVVLGDVAGWW